MADRTTPYIIMLGTSMSARGGMTSVVRCYQIAGLFERWNIHYIASYEASLFSTQCRVVSRTILLLLQALFSRRVSLIHIHSASRGSFWRKSLLSIFARIFRVPYVFHIHSGEFPDFYHKESGVLSKWWIRRTLGGAARVVALTDSWRHALSKIAPDAHLVTISNPVILPKSRPGNIESKPRSNVLFLGKLWQKKGIFDLVNAIPDVLKAFPEARFTLAGDGDRSSVHQLAHFLGVGDALELPGWVDGAAKAELLESASVLALPSYFEGLPMCVLEAMAVGVPVVASNVGGIPEVLDFGRCGWLVAPGDIAGISTAIIEALSSSEKCDDLRRAASYRVESLYSMKHIVSQIDTLYRQIQVEACTRP